MPAKRIYRSMRVIFKQIKTPDRMPRVLILSPLAPLSPNITGKFGTTGRALRRRWPELEYHTTRATRDLSPVRRDPGLVLDILPACIKQRQESSMVA